MRRLLVAAALAFAAACGTEHRVPVSVDWTFQGQPCDAAGVASIQVDIDGQLLTPNKFTCAQASQGVDLGTFIPGPYTLTVTGFDVDDNIIYQTTQDIEVGGRSNLFTIDVEATTGTASLGWTFAGKSCAAAGVNSVRVSVDDQVITDPQGNADLPCGGSGGDGVTIGPLSPGSHTFAVAAQGSGGDYSASNINVQVVAGQDAGLQVDLQLATPTTASADVRWNFQPGGKDCAQAGVDHVYVYFDPPPNAPWGNPVADTPCLGAGGQPVSELQVVDVPDGKHSFAIRGTRNNQLVYYTHQPLQTEFAAPFSTAVDLTAEPLP